MKLYYSILAIILALGSVRFYLASYLPILGDGAFHAYLVENIIKSGVLPSFSLYPALFHLEGAIFGLFVGNSYKFFSTMTGIISIVIMYLITKELFNSKAISLLVALFVAVHPFHMLYSSIFFIETTLTAFILFMIYSHIKFLKTNRNSWLIVTGLFLGAAISTKQIAYLLPFILLIQHLVFRFRKNDVANNLKCIKEIILIFLTSGFFAIFIYYFYQTTGTITDPANPLISFGPFTSKLAPDPKSVEVIYKSGIFKYHHFHQITLIDIFHLFNPSTYYYNVFHLPEILFLSFTLLGFIYIVFYRRNTFLYLFIFICMFLLAFYVNKTPRHFIQLQLLILVFPCSSILLVKKLIKEKKKKIISTTLIILLLVTSAFTAYPMGINDTKSKYYSMGWLSTRYPIINLIEAYTYIKEHSNPNDKVADPNYYECMYYANRTPFWLRPWEGTDFYLGIYNHDEKLLKKSLLENNIKYLVIIRRFITKGDPNTVQFIRYQDYLFIKNSGLFKLVFKKPGVEVYEFKQTKLQD